MSKNIWGPKLWYIIHNISYISPKKITNKYIFLYNIFYYKVIPNIIPCSLCKMNYLIHIKYNKINLKNKRNFINWTIHIHNTVNKTLNKKIKFNEIELYRLHSKFNFNNYIWYIEYLSNQVIKKYINVIYLIYFLDYLRFLIPNNHTRKKFNFVFNTFRRLLLTGNKNDIIKFIFILKNYCN